MLGPGVTYMAPPYVIPGVGILSIDSLGGEQKASKTNSGGKPVLPNSAEELIAQAEALRVKFGFDTPEGPKASVTQPSSVRV